MPALPLTCWSQVNLLVNAKGSVLQSDIVGSVQMRVYLTGMPVRVCHRHGCYAMLRDD